MVFEAVLFDLDDTLLSWECPAWSWEEIGLRRAEGLRRYLAGLAIDVDATALAAASHAAIVDAWRASRADPDHPSPRLGPALCDALDRLGAWTTAVDVDALCDAFGWEAIPGVVPLPDALFVLDELRERGLRIGIVTNSHVPVRLRLAELTTLGLAERIDVCVTSGDVGRLKPHPAIFHAALDVLGVAPGRALFVGDRPERDIKGANAVGMTSVLYRPPYLPAAAPFGAGETPDHTIAGLSEVLEIVR